MYYHRAGTIRVVDDCGHDSASCSSFGSKISVWLEFGSQNALRLRQVLLLPLRGKFAFAGLRSLLAFGIAASAGAGAWRTEVTVGVGLCELRQAHAELQLDWELLMLPRTWSRYARRVAAEAAERSEAAGARRGGRCNLVAALKAVAALRPVVIAD